MRCLAVDFDRADIDQALYAAFCGAMGEMFSSNGIDTPKFSQWIGSGVSHYMNACGKMDNYINATQGILPISIHINITDYGNFDRFLHLLGLTHCRPDGLSLSKKLSAEDFAYKSVSSGY